MAPRQMIRTYNAAAGGWGALRATGEALTEQGIAARGSATLLRVNQPTGFDCPGCAWPDPKHTSLFEFCENGAKAAEFYTSGRTSNEAAFLYQLFAREFGTNNFPDCSNICHEATSVGLPDSLGVGEGTCLREDFDHTSFTPASKSIPISIARSRPAMGAA
jgi:anaerobic selenocysteine-containing dehydrogenase